MTILRTAVTARLARFQRYSPWTAVVILAHRKLFDERRREDTAPVLALGDCLDPLH